MSRLATLLMMVIASLLVLVINEISKAWEFLIECGAGLGLVLILRWYWWRVNAWAEIAAMIVPLAMLPVSRSLLELKFPESLFFIVTVTTAGWMIVMYCTSPEKKEVLQAFYDRIRPGGPGWKDYAGNEKHESLLPLLVNWVLGVVLVYLSLFAVGKIILQQYLVGSILAAASVITFILLAFLLKKEYS